MSVYSLSFFFHHVAIIKYFFFPSASFVQIQVSKNNTVYFSVETKSWTKSKRNRNSIKTTITFSLQKHHTHTHTHAHTRTHTSTYSICLGRSSFKSLAMSPLASQALYSFLSSSIGLCAIVRNYIQLNKKQGVMWDLFCENAITASLHTPPPSNSTPPSFQIPVRRQKDQSHKRLTGQAHSTSL